MKAQTKALVASVVVIALALSAVSGITYSWFSDTEQSKIDVSTAIVDLEPTYTLSSGGGTATSAIGTTLSLGASTDGVQPFTLSKLAANQQFTIISDIENKSTVKTVYRMYATWEKSENSTIENYDIQNISINGKYLTTTAGTSDSPSVIITDWTELAAGADPSPTNITIATPVTYGDAGTSSGYKLPDGTDYTTGDWDAQTERSGLTINIVIQAYQGDYPYTEMTVADKKATATIPENKVVKATKAIEAKVGSGSISDVVMDFSNVGTLSGAVGESEETNVDVTGTKVTAEVTKISTEDSTVTVDLNLWKVNSGSNDEKIESPKFDQPVVITMTVPGALSNPKVVYNEDGEDGTVLSSTINSNDTTTVVFSVTHFSNYTIKQDKGVENEQELRNALLKGGYIKLADSISVSKSLVCAVDGTVLDLNGKILSQADGFDDKEGNYRALIEVQSNLTIKNGDLTSLDKKNYRVLNINDLETDVTLNLDDVDVVGPSSGTYSRGISVYGNTGTITVNIDGGSVSAYYYALNIGAYNSKVIMNVTDSSAVSGYSAVQTHSKNTELYFTNCELSGKNNFSGNSDDFATIVLNDYDGITADGSKVVLNNCKIGTYTTGSASEFLLSLRCKQYTVELDSCEYVWKSNAIELSEVVKDKNGYIQTDTGTTFTEENGKLTITYDVIVDTIDELKSCLTEKGDARLGSDLSGISGSITLSDDAVLDLNGHSIAFTGEAGFVYSAEFYVTGIADNSKITSETGPIFKSGSESSILGINGGEYEAGRYVVYSDMGEDIIIADGVFTTTESEGNGSFTFYVWNSNLTISGGTFNGTYQSCIYVGSNCDLTITGGTFSGSEYVIDSSSSANVKITGGKFIGNSTNFRSITIFASSGSLTITGGEFSITHGGKDAWMFAVGDAEISIIGGNYTLDAESVLVAANKRIISGGTFNVDPSAFLVSGYTATEKNGTWTVAKSS